MQRQAGQSSNSGTGAKAQARQAEQKMYEYTQDNRDSRVSDIDVAAGEQQSALLVLWYSGSRG
jgi:hypothetical protein